jgi:hypothetical protein
MHIHQVAPHNGSNNKLLQLRPLVNNGPNYAHSPGGATQAGPTIKINCAVAQFSNVTCVVI